MPHPDKQMYPDGNLFDPAHGAKVLKLAPGLDQIEVSERFTYKSLQAGTYFFVQILPFRVAAYDKLAGKMDFFDPLRKADFEFISGTKMRSLARSGILAEYYQGIANK